MGCALLAADRPQQDTDASVCLVAQSLGCPAGCRIIGQWDCIWIKCHLAAMHIAASVFINDEERGLHADYEDWQLSCWLSSCWWRWGSSCGGCSGAGLCRSQADRRLKAGGGGCIQAPASNKGSFRTPLCSLRPPTAVGRSRAVRFCASAAVRG